MYCTLCPYPLLGKKHSRIAVLLVLVIVMYHLISHIRICTTLPSLPQPIPTLTRPLTANSSISSNKHAAIPHLAGIELVDRLLQARLAERELLDLRLDGVLRREGEHVPVHSARGDERGFEVVRLEKEGKGAVRG